ncbi:MAG: hypothetical protein KGJ80_22390 [Chloroflexota bacterium]|nr:hypothetical protein [Chloroflexota bacterium]
MPLPTIKTIERTRQIREKNYQRLLGLSRAERLAFYREHARLMKAKAAMLVTPKQSRSIVMPRSICHCEHLLRSDPHTANWGLLRREERSSQ